jgi:hypothetical protein
MRAHPASSASRPRVEQHELEHRVEPREIAEAAAAVAEQAPDLLLDRPTIARWVSEWSPT